MALFGISDLHLSLGCDKPMDVFPGWKDYVARLEKNWRAMVSEEDTVVIGGDISWALKLEETEEDFAFLHGLPGKKLFLKGNHDLWWSTARKLHNWFEEKGFSSLELIFNSAAPVGGPVRLRHQRMVLRRGIRTRIKKVLNREVGRLTASIEAGLKTGLEPVVFLHYPPVYHGQVCTEILEVLKNTGFKGAITGTFTAAGAKYAETGEFQGIQPRLIACDYTGFRPVLIR